MQVAVCLYLNSVEGVTWLHLHHHRAVLMGLGLLQRGNDTKWERQVSQPISSAAFANAE